MAEIHAFKPLNQLQLDAFQTIRIDSNLLVDLYEAVRLVIPPAEDSARPSAHDLCVALAGYWTRHHGRRPTVGNLVELLHGQPALQATLAAWSDEDLGTDLPALVLASRLRELAALDVTAFTAILLNGLKHLTAYGRAVYGDRPSPDSGPASS